MEPVTVQGTNLIQNGKVFHYVGVSEFSLFKRWLMKDGPYALVEPRLQEWRSFGYNGPIVLRVFRYAAYWNPFSLLPWSYNFDEITHLTTFCNRRGFLIDWTCGDSQEVLPEQNGPKGQQQHLNETCAALVPCGGAIVETCNESFKNGIDVSKVIPPKWGSYLRDSGYYEDNANWNYSLDLDIISFHGNREDSIPSKRFPKWVIDLDDQLSYLLAHPNQKPVVLKEPMGFDEIIQPGRRSTNPEHAFLLGQKVAMGGVVFHSTHGITGNHLGPITTQCAQGFFNGVRGALVGLA